MGTVWKHHAGEVWDGDGGQQRLHTRDLLGPDVERCEFCGEASAAAYWRTAGGVLPVCRPCAEDALPRLLADAVVGEAGGGPNAARQLQGALGRAEATYWRAGCLAMARGARGRSAEPPAPPPAPDLPPEVGRVTMKCFDPDSKEA
jgi:hypothetical protein